MSKCVDRCNNETECNKPLCRDCYESILWYFHEDYVDLMTEGEKSRTISKYLKDHNL